MAGQGDIDVRVVEDPTAANMKTALDLAITATSASAAVSIAPLGMGKGMMIVTVEGA